MDHTEMTLESSASLPAGILAWLSSWEQCVQDQAYEPAAELFDLAVHSYGTVMPVVSGRAALMAQQWGAVWPRTQGFRFTRESLQGWGDAQRYCIAGQWVSEGLDAASQIPFQREGRATLLLQKVSGAWLAVHSHLSINPEPERFLITPATKG